MNQSILGRRAPAHVGALRRHTPALGVGIVTSAVALATLGAVPAQSAPPDPANPECPPAATTVTDGQQVTGKTVSKGTVPEPFTGEVLGVLENGIGPNLDMIMVELSSPQIDKVGGIWQGMSGSPVYDEAGDLVGAVAYGLAWGASPIAGLTPATEMQKLLTAAPTDPQARATLEGAQDTVPLPDTEAKALLRSGAATRAEVSSGFSRLPLPIGISGSIDRKRLRATLDRHGLGEARLFQTGAVTANTADVPIVSGGNLAASLAYGDFNAIALGTATAVCGSEILAFGHPVEFTGRSNLTMHGAKALFVQEDSLGVPFKVGNAGAPAGRITQDRFAGVLGVPGTLPPTTKVTSMIELGHVPGLDPSSYATTISAPNWVPDFAAWHVFTTQERAFDAHAPGSQVMTWTVKGHRQDGSTFRYTRGDRFADPNDIIWAAPDELFMQLYRLQQNGSERITFSDISTDTTMTDVYQAYRLGKVQLRAGGTWRRLPQQMFVRPGTTKRFKVTLVSDQLPDRDVRLEVVIPRTAKRWGELTFMGGNSFYGGEEFWYEPTAGPGFDRVLKEIRSAPRNDEVVATLRLRRVGGGTVSRTDRVQTRAVVTGERYVGIEVIR